MKHIIAGAVGALFLGTVGGPAGAQLPGPVQSETAERSGSAAVSSGVTQDVGDAEFLLDALRTNLAEIQLAELAEERAENVQVREYAATLHADHSASLRELQDLVNGAGLVAPTEPSGEALAQYAALQARTGADFDGLFIAHMAESHRQAVAAYGAQTHANPNETLSAFASKTLPVLREHLATAEQLQQLLAREARER